MFCAHFQNGKVFKRGDERLRKCLPNNNKLVKHDTKFCDKFRMAPYFWCDFHGERVNLTACMHRQKTPEKYKKHSENCAYCYTGEMVQLLFRGGWGKAPTQNPQQLVKRKLVKRKKNKPKLLVKRKKPQRQLVKRKRK
jgi:hypothetical protein